jgi:uncharacterized protein YqfB (UPF0267 family)
MFVNEGLLDVDVEIIVDGVDAAVDSESNADVVTVDGFEVNCVEVIDVVAIAVDRVDGNSMVVETVFVDWLADIKVISIVGAVESVFVNDNDDEVSKNEDKVGFIAIVVLFVIVVSAVRLQTQIRLESTSSHCRLPHRPT